MLSHALGLEVLLKSLIMQELITVLRASHPGARLLVLVLSSHSKVDHTSHNSRLALEVSCRHGFLWPCLDVECFTVGLRVAKVAQGQRLEDRVVVVVAAVQMHDGNVNGKQDYEQEEQV